MSVNDPTEIRSRNHKGRANFIAGYDAIFRKTLEPRDPVERFNGTWGFWDETWTHFYGDYGTEDRAREAFQEYVDSQIEGHNRIPYDPEQIENNAEEPGEEDGPWADGYEERAGISNRDYGDEQP